MQANRSRDTAPEMALRRLLHAKGLRYRVDAPVVVGLRCRGDVLFPRARVVVFVDGCFWHRCPVHATDPVANRDWWRAKFERTVERDVRNEIALTSAGWTVVRIWEHEDMTIAADRVADLVVRAREQRLDAVVLREPPRS